MDRKPDRRNKAAVLSFSGVLRTEPKSCACKPATPTVEPHDQIQILFIFCDLVKSVLMLKEIKRYSRVSVISVVLNRSIRKHYMVM